ncbi:TonB-linked SusC/RagA family outer membrane protein [Parabacteroides sp. PFB2-12]|nr:TonB-linked SusC/RagA family outer membrane protein [Parabacteroides sp. PM6-13]MDH6390209.1 TonB-linked SusC/RagA family outer membrane protein [Parabacteroides sp. PFB2-12]
MQMKEDQKPKGLSHQLLFIIIGMFLSLGAFAQHITVNGRVIDKDGEPIIGASILQENTTIGTVTNYDGEYSLHVPANSTIIISYVGYSTQTISVQNRTTINITLLEDTQLLDDVIVVGYATGSQRTISGSVAKVGKEDMNVGVVLNPLQAMKGKVAGVNISKSGGDPAAGSTIRVRGTTSLSGGNNPLVIVDGVFADMAILNSLAPGDIESFTVLKDASETAQYGSRGASGVIVVNTTKGKSGVKDFSYDGTFGVESVYKNLEMLSADQYRAAATGMNFLDKGHSSNFLEEMQRTGFTQNHRISFGGGSTDYSNYRVSLGVIDQEGIIQNSEMRNYTLKMDASQMMFNNKLLMEVGMFGSKIDKRYVNDYQKTFYSAASHNPTFATTPDSDGIWPEDLNANEIHNPMGRLQINDRESFANINAHAKLTWSITPDLKLSGFGSYTFSVKENQKYIPTTIKAGQGDKGEASRIDHKNSDLMGNLMLNYKKTFGQHYIDALGLVEAQKYTRSGFNATARGFDTDFFGYNNLGAGANVKYGDVGSYWNEYQLLSYMGRFNYVFANKYIATINLRADGSSKLGANNKWGFFPSGSLAWDIAQEDFLKNISQGKISQMKLRAGYGLTGNQDAIAAYNSLSLMGPSGTTTVNGAPAVTYGFNRNANPDLRWEVKRMFDVGLDMGFFDDRLTATVDYYMSKTSDLLYNYDVPVPPFVYPTLLANLGEMKNNGLEVSLTGIPLQTNDMQLTLSANVSYQKNELISLNGTYMDQELSAKQYMNLAGMNGAGFIGGNNQITYQMVGQPLGVFYLPKCDGLIFDEASQSYKYHILDIDGEEGIDLSDGKDRYIAGQAMPKFYVAGNINFRYKNWDLQTQLNGAFGHKIYNGTSLTYMNMVQFPTYNVLKEAPEKNIKDQTVTDYWLEKGDYLHIDYLSIGYTLNTKNIDWMNSLRISASVNNLYTFTNYSGLSPMINSAEVNDNLGVDDKRFYPLSRTFSIGLSVNF